MALKLPPEGHPVRALFNVSDVPTTATAYRLLPTLNIARGIAKAAFAEDRARADYGHPRKVHLVHLIVAHSDGRVLLMCFGPKGGFRTRWNFGRWASEPPTFRCRWPNCRCDPTTLSGMTAHPSASNDRKCKNVT